jgi:CRP-like cAMP-binding protein
MHVSVMVATPFEALAKSMRALAPLGEPALAALRCILVSRSFPADAWVLRAGEHARMAYFIAQGLVREFYCDEQGAEHTRRFCAAGDMTGSLLDLLSGEAAVTYIQTLEPTHTLAFDYRQFDTLCARHADLELCARRATELLYIRKAQREHAMLALSARERLEQWQREYPALDARVSRKQLASYLGVTPEHLSRLRKRS